MSGGSRPSSGTWLSEAGVGPIVPRAGLAAGRSASPRRTRRPRRGRRRARTAQSSIPQSPVGRRAPRGDCCGRRSRPRLASIEIRHVRPPGSKSPVEQRGEPQRQSGHRSDGGDRRKGGRDACRVRKPEIVSKSGQHRAERNDPHRSRIHRRAPTRKRRSERRPPARASPEGTRTAIRALARDTTPRRPADRRTI